MAITNRKGDMPIAGTGRGREIEKGSLGLGDVAEPINRWPTKSFLNAAMQQPMSQLGHERRIRANARAAGRPQKPVAVAVDMASTPAGCDRAPPSARMCKRCSLLTELRRDRAEVSLF